MKPLSATPASLYRPAAAYNVTFTHTLSSCLVFFKKNWWTHVLFVGPLIPLFRTSGDFSYGFQSQSGQLYSHCVEAYVCIQLFNYSRPVQ